MKNLPLLLIIVFCASSCYHTDKQTIQALINVNRSLVDGKNILERNNEHTHALFESSLHNDPRKVKLFYDKGMSAIHLSDSMVQQLQLLKIKLAEEVGGMNIYKDDSIENMDNKDAVAKCNSLLLNGADAKAKILKASIVSYRKKMMSLLNFYPRDTMLLYISLLVPEYSNANGEKLSWEDYTFKNAPLLVDIVSLTRLQVDIRACESTIITYLLATTSISHCGYYPATFYFNRFFGGKMVATPQQLDSVNWISLTPPIDASFEMQLIEKGKHIVLSSKNCAVTPEMHNEMKKLSKGDKVIIQNVEMMAPDSSVRKYVGPDITILIE